MISLFFFPYEENPLAGGIPLGDFVFSTEEGVSLLSIFFGEWGKSGKTLQIWAEKWGNAEIFCKKGLL